MTDRRVLQELDRIAREYAQDQAVGCCGDATWRGRLCQYHSGVEDGFYAGLLTATKDQP